MSDDDLQGRIYAWLGPQNLRKDVPVWDQDLEHDAIMDERLSESLADGPRADDPIQPPSGLYGWTGDPDDLSDEELAAWEAEGEQTEEEEAATIQRLRELRKQYRARLSVPEHHREQARLYTEGTAIVDEIRPVPGTVQHQTVEAALAVGRKNGALDPSRSCVYASAYARALKAMKPTSSDQEGDAG